ncbi:metal-dependent transcriptional regulator [Kineothrix sp. MB12-C1]|uniref:metal-dependent transcriptional regulator n=1 Tax=Kineothrix sp. MB12-C1 TaxID=3070215 RepID=UPI0027D22E56|nr:metal-dependent transcriptional regulator [Kineothrix sp. MB12-C1]WMC94208.1 metal-dependent transcriptional regulator [Kineothrix sp. MB12-C1]
MSENEFFTIRGYSLIEQKDMSYAMEDYLEMIYRHARKGKYMRVNQLASLLNVRPPSASKMTAKLRDSGMIQFEPYGIIQLTKRGEEIGAYLLHRHEVLHSLFCRITCSENELELVEKIEHAFDMQMIEKIEFFLRSLETSIEKAEK